MEIRTFLDSDIRQIVSLFYETVHSINKRDYSHAQLHAWAPKDEETLKLITWNDSLRNNITYVAEINGTIVGFADMTHHGYLDRLYVHKNAQRQGIASALVNTLEHEARKLGLIEMVTDASITAKPFFERRGYHIVKSQIMERRNVTLANFKMIKNI
ncbi:GNAT family N-acetyltransferase [Paenibacillus sp. 481]|uniref:GNAT family N-acetyltransferase n=1 Tax=Paenibacillus sp. 481 TaxID=2835869 RepID=UPI001E327DD8|nr:GNAT family N-acetyltransferase [Paenibacillus sp. 481]UHA73227.1 GNAT family N-acetyltransferase [Paenibacillus sp. 481]